VRGYCHFIVKSKSDCPLAFMSATYYPKLLPSHTFPFPLYIPCVVVPITMIGKEHDIHNVIRMQTLTFGYSVIEADQIVWLVSLLGLRANFFLRCYTHILHLGIKRQTECRYAHVANLLE
jgi:hypothetical protein